MKIRMMEIQQANINFKGSSGDEYDKIVDKVTALTKGEVVKIQCENRKPNSIYCSLRLRLIKLGVFEDFTSHINKDKNVLYMTRR